MRIAEDRLRDGLRELAEEADPNVRAVDVIALVEGRHRQRSIRQLVAACAAVTTAGLLGWFALAPRPVTVQPAPLASAMVRPGTATGVFGFTVGDPVVRQLVTVRAESTAAQVLITVTEEVVGRPGEISRNSYVTPPGQFFSARVHDRLEIALIPDVVDAVQTIGRTPDDLRRWADRQTGVTLTATWLHGDEQASRLVWMGSDGLVHTQNGVLPSAGLAIDGTTLTLYREAEQDAWGVFGPPDNYWVAHVWERSSDAEVRIFLSSVDRRASVGRLPSDATAVTITPAEKARWTVGTMPDGTHWYFVLSDQEVHSDSSTHRLVRSIAYTDRTGKRITYTPKLSS
ncbi:hypothetical protein [Micropruina sp.]|uniref:hypothetical protein n=1 Tax=Micropruina sp. TaxID=2737536 RepID=UPI0039E4FD8D